VDGRFSQSVQERDHCALGAATIVSLALGEVVEAIAIGVVIMITLSHRLPDEFGQSDRWNLP
jgi:hypothetical protein